jgi:pilus assembly protein CpaF
MYALWCQTVEDRVRELRLDPPRDSQRVHGLIDRISGEVMIGAGAAGGPGNDGFEGSVAADVGQVSQSVQHAISGFGPLLPFFEDDSIEEIWVNEPGRVFVARGEVSELTPVVMTAGQVRDVVERMMRCSGRRLDLSQPFVDATLPDGSRLHVVIPDVTKEHWAINVRRFVVRPRSMLTGKPVKYSNVT